MTRQLFDKVSGEWLDPDEYYFRKAANSQQVSRSDLPAPMCISDCMEPRQSMADGKYYSSKADMRKSYLASGNPQGVRYTEVGNDPARKRATGFQKPKIDEKSVSDSVDKAFARLNRGEVPQFKESA